MSNNKRPNGFAWDPKQHDAKLKERPKSITVDLICKCGGTNFLPVHQVQFIKTGNHVQIGFSNPPDVTCTKCGMIYLKQKLVEMAKNAGERPHLSIAPETENDPA